MRRAVFFGGLAGSLGLFAVAAAEASTTRVFLVANQPDGYGVDQCLANGEACGAAVARAYCRARQFETATAFRKVARDDVTAEILHPAAAGRCSATDCSDFVAITCQR